ncbi:PREDICTED: uncharacterized protein LOC108760400 [Trachymyrmex cornetzi]|uniref:uncharacterized protein LOC108760400 n=1 Tax=Trachymyrmex cornetzi TaxID=471704 RepID=UPI00084F3A1B|nr:PREDICTED: uncharacterized protein LOC108760400 [Trachymyrmex cornetzi]
MPKRVCCVRNCDFNPGDKENRKTIFQFCEKSPYFKTWMNAIGPNLRDGKKTRKNYYICERHFDDGNLHRIPMNILKDGKEVTLLRRRPMLKSTSVPYIFPVNIKVTCDLWRCCIKFLSTGRYTILGKHGYAKQNLHAGRFAHPHFPSSLHFIPNFFAFQNYLQFL